MRSDGEDAKTVAWVAPTDLGAMQKALVDAGHDCTANLVHEPMMLVECATRTSRKSNAHCREVYDAYTVEHNMALFKADDTNPPNPQPPAPRSARALPNCASG